MANTANEKRVVFGLSNVHYALYDDNNSTYGTPKEIPGAVNLSITAEGDSSIFYADNVPYASFETNGGYTGSIEIACASDTLLVDLMGWTTDKNGAVIESADATQPTFALMYEVSSNLKPQRFVFYNCTLARPENEANTTTDSTDPDTQKLNISMISRELTYGTGKINATKASLIKSDANATKYANFMSAVYMPDATA